MMTERFRCDRCTMSFRMELPRYREKWTRCAEPGCGRRFWHVARPSQGDFICGVDPNDPEHRLPADVLPSAITTPTVASLNFAGPRRES